MNCIWLYRVYDDPFIKALMKFIGRTAPLMANVQLIFLVIPAFHLRINPLLWKMLSLILSLSKLFLRTSTWNDILKNIVGS